MVTKEIQIKIAKLMSERLVPFNVPHEIRNSLLDDIIGAIEAPSANRLGATVMTAEASRDADKERKHGPNSDHAKPRVI